ncbi:MAG: class I SAM-dependent methyltransferase [Polyangiaceae bacterium]
MSESLTCPSCGCPDHGLVFTSWNGYPIRRCGDCHLVFTDDRKAPPPDQLYPAFEQSSSAAQKSVRQALSLFLRQRAAFVKKVARASGGGKPRLLDYGCGSGAFARFMTFEGFEVVGLEPFSLGAPTEEPGLTLVRAPLEKAGAELGKFDVITLWHVLEHVHKPVELLRSLTKHLAPGGVMVISVPNFASAQSELFKGAWFHLDPPRHLDASSPRRSPRRSPSRAAVLAGVQDERLGANVLNKVLPHKNFLFRLVKDRGALAGMPAGSTAAHLGASVVLGAPVLAALRAHRGRVLRPEPRGRAHGRGPHGLTLLRRPPGRRGGGRFGRRLSPWGASAAARHEGRAAVVVVREGTLVKMKISMKRRPAPRRSAAAPPRAPGGHQVCTGGVRPGRASREKVEVQYFHAANPRP